MPYRIRNWDTHFENNRTRELKHLEWVPVPNRMDGDGYTELVDHPDAAAHLGAWLAVLEICSRQKPRGTFPRCPQGDAGIPQVLARISRLPASVFELLIPRLFTLQWIELIPQDGAVIPQDGAVIPQDGAAIPQDGAARARGGALRRMEGNGREGKAAAASANGKPPLESTEALIRWQYCREALLTYPNAVTLDTKLDDQTIRSCLEIADNDIQRLRSGLERMAKKGKKPESSWAWFPKVLAAHLESSK